MGHGIEPLPGGGEVIIEGSEDGGMIVLSVRNPLPLDSEPGGATGSERGSAPVTPARIGHGIGARQHPRAP